ncbi:MAG: membrane protein insertion efficiency factor YidD [Deltaproteobacteria bacterium]|nr:membrane protein insertion efficiency factor YidD [Deltaproteobacteria bacterium]
MLVRMIHAYRRFVSRLLGPRCRFYPTCSEYALICLEQDALSRALFKIFVRLLKCNPLFAGGEDLP